VHEANSEEEKIKGSGNAWVDGTDPDRKHSNDIVHLLDQLIQNLEYQVE
jgi:hypothetical protein